MSAFVVSNDHIDALLSFACDANMRHQLSGLIDTADAPLNWTTIGRILLAENERSVNHRYRDIIADDAIDYGFRYFEPFVHMQPTKKCVWVIKACDCFDYQACETDDYEQSIAYNLIAAIRQKAVRSLPQYDAAPWEITRDIKAPA